VRPEEFQALVDHDEHHWWYVGRRAVLHAAIGRLGLPADASVLDAGCGSGRTMDDLRRYGAVHGFDLNPLGVDHARGRGHEDVTVARVEEIPFDDASFDLVTCLDVIEHTPDDVRSLRELLRVTRPGGRLVVTVPAYQLLWSSHDEANQHFRRYRRPQLRRAAIEAGWEPGAWTYFNSLLFAPAAVVRLGERLRRRERRGGRPQAALTPSALDGVLTWPMRFEARLVGLGVSLPFGLSLLMAFRRPEAGAGVGQSALVAGASVNNL
jgi:SAM-dependent methyltransferase